MSDTRNPLTDQQLDDDRAVQVLSDEGAQCGVCGDQPGDRICPDCEECRARYVAALRAAGWTPQADVLGTAADVVDAKLTAEPDHNRASALYELLLQLRGELSCTCARSGGLHAKGCRKYVPGHELISRHNQLAVCRAAAVGPDAASAPPAVPVSADPASSVSESAQSPTGASAGALRDSVALEPEAPLPDRLEAVLAERFTELGNPHSRMRIQEEGPDGWPTTWDVSPSRVAEVLRELLATTTAR